MASPNIVDRRMSGEEFDTWYAEQPEKRRYELMDGLVHPNFDGLPDDPYAQGERVAHNRIKMAVANALSSAVRNSAPGCEVFGDGMPVLADEASRFEPDAQVRCGPPLPGSSTLVRDPVIVVEVSSPSTKRIDALEKFTRYFANPSISHYLILLADRRRAIHHRRMQSGDILSTALTAMDLVRFDPPGVEISLADVFGPEEEP